MIVPKRSILWPLAALAVFAGLKQTVLAPREVRTVGVERRELSVHVYGNGTVEAKVVVPVSTKTTGRLADLFADQGSGVTRGQLLATLESDDVKQQAEQARAGLERAGALLAVEDANLRKARASLELAEKNAARFKNLAALGLVSRMDADQYENVGRVAAEEVTRGQAAVEAAVREQGASRANLAVATARIADTVVRAPQSGVVLSRDLERGATVTPGAAIFRLADPSTVWVAANVDESRAGEVAVGQRALISLRSAPGKVFPGRVARLGRESDRVTEELPVDVAFDRPLKDFRLGERAEVFIVAKTLPAALCVPENTLTASGPRRGVWVAEGGTLQFRAVVVGVHDPGGYAQIVSGLTGREAVVLAPVEELLRFKEGRRVRVAR